MGMDGQDPYATRRQELDAQFRALPAAGSPGYWAALQTQNGAEAVPLEVVGRCLRERHNAGRRDEAERVFAVILGRIQRTVGGWSHHIAKQCRKADAAKVAEDLQQECFTAIWQELTEDTPSFLFEQFSHALKRLEQHTAESVMTREGEWKRRGVNQSTRILSDVLDSIDTAERGGADTDAASAPLRELPDHASSEAMSLAERAIDVSTALASLDADMRDLLYDVYWRGLTQDEIAQRLHMTDRTVRNRLKRALDQFRVLYLGGEEGQRD